MIAGFAYTASCCSIERACISDRDGDIAYPKQNQCCKQDCKDDWSEYLRHLNILGQLYTSWNLTQGHFQRRSHLFPRLLIKPWARLKLHKSQNCWATKLCFVAGAEQIDRRNVTAIYLTCVRCCFGSNSCCSVSLRNAL